MLLEWLAMEHYRIHVMERWPDGPRKEAGLAAARSALGSLIQTMPEASSFVCATCAGRRRPVVAMSSSHPVTRLRLGLAA
jgi:hypothetical protein